MSCALGWPLAWPSSALLVLLTVGESVPHYTYTASHEVLLNLSCEHGKIQAFVPTAKVGVDAIGRQRLKCGSHRTVIARKRECAIVHVEEQVDGTRSVVCRRCRCIPTGDLQLAW